MELGSVVVVVVMVVLLVVPFLFRGENRESSIGISLLKL